MTIENSLQVQKRKGLGKGENRRLRAGDLVPGVFYNAVGANIAVQVPSLPMEKLLAAVGRNTVFNIEIDNDGKKETHPALIWDIQRHPYKRAFLHVDFYGVDLTREVVVRVPLEFIGAAKGVKLGGQLETYRENVRLSGKPLDMPKKISIDVSGLDVNDAVHVADLTLPEGIAAVYSTNYCIVAVHIPGAEEDEATAGAAAEPAAAG
ncbi:MAG: 50S ribosomal protein L25/general stress protein Ctc [Deltaproteobacteria bacterium]|jgi:large subunit ribosomal protein L25|nr:50S ribosomal protein L25/general stress protein Ctc [Deltaproteobacteria bacterium]